jgi:hypothetical protein
MGIHVNIYLHEYMNVYIRIQTCIYVDIHMYLQICIFKYIYIPIIAAGKSDGISSPPPIVAPAIMAINISMPPLAINSSTSPGLGAKPGPGPEDPEPDDPGPDVVGATRGVSEVLVGVAGMFISRGG